MPSLLEALELKYGSSTTDCSLTDEETESSSPALSISIFIPKKSPRHTVPALLVLQDCDIECAGNDDEKLRTKCRNVEELDLAQNKLSQWDEVFGILQHMPKIKFVNLSFNSLAESLMIKDGNYKSLRNLVLNGTRVTWSTVQDLVRLLDNLEELHLSLNEYKNVELDHTKVENKNASLRKLHFTGNPIESWTEISKLGYVFPSLESLVLAECPIRSLALEENLNVDSDKRSQLKQQQQQAIVNGTENVATKEDENENVERLTTDPETSSKNRHEPGRIFGDEKSYNRTESECESSGNKGGTSHDPFRMLRFLNVNGTLLSTWDDVERLARFPALKALRMQSCPLFEVSGAVGYLAIDHFSKSGHKDL